MSNKVTNTNQTLERAKELLKRLDRFEKFEAKYNIAPAREGGNLATEMRTFAHSIPQIGAPQNNEELLLSEIKRRLHGDGSYLEQRVSGRLYSFDTVISILGIPKEDIDALRPWLEQNRDKTQDAVERLFHSRDIEGYEIPLAEDVPGVRRQAEEFVAAHIQRYHKVLGKFLEGRTNVGGFLRDINAVPTNRPRSYFNSLTNTVAVSVPDVCYTKEDGTLHIRDGELVKLFGHEAMGHALNYVVTRSSGLPHFLTQPSALTVATEESVAQFYERQLLEDLMKSKETQRALGIDNRFGDIYQEAKDTEQLNEYRKREFQYGIVVLADKSLGDPNDPAVLRRKTDLLAEVALDRSKVAGWVQRARYENFDSEGNLSPSIVGELRYCAQPVTRALGEFAKRGIRYEGEGRNTIDATLLKGLWTPTGFVDNARLRAEKK